MNAALQSAINAMRAAPFADHGDIAAFVNAFATRIADARGQFPGLDLETVSEAADEVAELLDGVFVREVTGEERAAVLREMEADDARAAA
jgi:hypothetical protein